MPQYRGLFHHGGRSPHDCPAEQDYTRREFCDAVDPFDQWVCTRSRGHTGDHVAQRQLLLGARTVLSRWGPRGQITDREAGECSAT